MSSDIDGCSYDLCQDGDDIDAVCVDNPAPMDGYTCHCSSGYIETLVVEAGGNPTCVGMARQASDVLFLFSDRRLHFC